MDDPSQLKWLNHQNGFVLSPVEYPLGMGWRRRSRVLLVYFDQTLLG